MLVAGSLSILVLIMHLGMNFWSCSAFYFISEFAAAKQVPLLAAGFLSLTFA